jgi:uncharacterized protein (TIGR02246 family)
MRTVGCLILLLCPLLPGRQPPEAAVRAVLDEQVNAWNEGNLERFVRTYAPDTLFVGKEVRRGSAGVLKGYRRNYPTRERMGTLTFSGLEVRMLGADFASVLGRFHLQRAPEAGGTSQGIFTLILRRSGDTWSIILDHTS